MRIWNHPAADLRSEPPLVTIAEVTESIDERDRLEDKITLGPINRTMVRHKK